jgi:hypothetical protein
MKHASTTSVVRAAPGGGRLARLVQAGVAALTVAVLSSGTAYAQRHGDHGDQAELRGQEQRMQDQRMQDPRMQQQREPRFDPRVFDTREYEEQRRQQDQGMRQDPRRSSGRLTPDERRDLRRQINEAGMDLYPHPSRR